MKHKMKLVLYPFSKGAQKYCSMLIGVKKVKGKRILLLTAVQVSFIYAEHIPILGRYRGRISIRLYVGYGRCA